MKNYTTPTFDKLTFQSEDIITASVWGIGLELGWKDDRDLPKE